jgi:hypothetical protein
MRMGPDERKARDEWAARRAPWHLWIVGAVGLLFNVVGVVDWVMTQAHNESYMSRFTPEQLEVIYGLPTWLVAFWAIAVWAGAFGALLLLLRRSYATLVLAASLFGMLVTAVHNFLSANGLYETGGTGPGFVAVIFAVSLSLVLYARAMTKRKVLA